MTETETTDAAEPVAEPVAPVEAPAAEPATPKTADELWNIELKLPEPEQETPAPAKEEKTDDDQGDAVSSEPLPEESPNPSDESDDAQFEKLEKLLETHDPDKPIPLTRKQRDEKARAILEPFRDENVPIEDVYRALNEFQPVRTEELARKLVYNSLEADPESWIAEIGRITGRTFVDAATVEGGGQSPNTAPVSTFEAQPDVAEVIRQLDDIYGQGEWRDPANDGNVSSDDLALIKAFRAQIGRENELTNAHKAEIDALKAELDALKPQVDEIANAREAEFQARRNDILMSDVNEYRQAVEGKAFPKAFANLGLAESESDSDDVKTLKSLITSRFKPHEGGDYSEFDYFVENGFSRREQVSKTIQRVGKYLNQAADLDAKAIKSPKQAETFQTQANALRAEAKAEQDALTVLTQNAAREFVEKDWKAISNVLAELAELKRSRGGRAEIVSPTTGATETFGDHVRATAANGGNPWDTVSERFERLMNR